MIFYNYIFNYILCSHVRVCMYVCIRMTHGRYLERRDPSLRMSSTILRMHLDKNVECILDVPHIQGCYEKT